MFKLISNLFSKKEVVAKKEAVVKLERHRDGGAIIRGDLEGTTICHCMNLKATDEEVNAQMIQIKNQLENGLNSF